MTNCTFRVNFNYYYKGHYVDISFLYQKEDIGYRIRMARGNGISRE